MLLKIVTKARMNPVMPAGIISAGMFHPAHAPPKHNGSYTSKIEQLRRAAAVRARPPTRPPTTTVATTTSTYSPHDCGRDTAGILWCAGNRIFEKKEKKKPKPKPNNGGRVVLSKYAQKITAAKPTKAAAWVAPKPNLKIAKNKQQVKPAAKPAGGGGGGIFAKGGSIPGHIQAKPFLSHGKSDMCRNNGGWGEPCR